MKITHLSVYKILQDGVFNNVNSYEDMNNSIKTYGEKFGLSGTDKYNESVGACFEIFTQFFCMKYGNTPLLGITKIVDTSDDPYQVGYDFTFIDLNGNNGQIQSKWRSNPTHQFTIGELATNSAIASDNDISKDNNILFINIDDVKENLFHYSYKTARNKRRVIGRDSQEEFILRDSNFWEEFRNCIKLSSKNEFIEPYKLRDTQEWTLYGTNKNGVIYEGTDSVVSGKYSKGRIEVSTGGGKTLCQFYDFNNSFHKYGKNLGVMILPTISLINQTFTEFYKWGLFGSDVKSSDVSCLIIMSGSKPRYNNQIANVLQTLSVDESVSFIEDQISNNRKVLIFTTMRSHGLKYVDIVNKLKDKSIRIGIEVVDEYHNIISSSDRKEQLETYDYLKNSEDRTDGSLFYSASNKSSQLLSTFNEDLFGKLLCKVNREDLRIRGYVSPKLVFKIVRVDSRRTNSESKRSAKRIGLDLEKAQTEAVAIISSYKDLCDYYDNPNLITFGDHVEGCRYISNNEDVVNELPDVKNHFIASETSNSERDNIINHIRNSNGNILHQHSVAKEGININNLHGCIIGRNMSKISLQQAIGRSDRTTFMDQIKFERGEISLDNPYGWDKYYNILYVKVESDDIFQQSVKEIIGYLLNEGIPEDVWDISELIDDSKGGVNFESPNFSPNIQSSISFNKDNFRKMIENVKIELIEENNNIKRSIEEEKKRESLNSMDWMELMKSKSI